MQRTLKKSILRKWQENVSELPSFVCLQFVWMQSPGLVHARQAFILPQSYISSPMMVSLQYFSILGLIKELYIWWSWCKFSEGSFLVAAAKFESV